MKRGLGPIKQLEKRLMLDAAAMAAIADAVIHVDAQAQVEINNNPEAGATPTVDFDVSANGGDAYIGAGGSDINEALFDVDDSGLFAFDISFPASNPQGALFEIGGQGRGTYIGFDDAGNFVARAGDGSTSFNADQTARVSIDPTGVLLGKSGTLFTHIDMDNASITVWFKEGGSTSNNPLILVGQDVADNGGALGGGSGWSGGDDGGVGIATSSIAGAETTSGNSDFNGTITDFRYYDGKTFSSFTDFAADPSDGFINNPINLDTINPSIDNDAFGSGVQGWDFSTVNDALVLDSSNDVNLSGNYDEKSFALTFRTGDVLNSDQVIYEQGGGTNAYVIGIFDADGAGAGTDYHLYAYAYAGSDTTIIDLGQVTADTVYSTVIVHDGNAGTFSAAINGGALQVAADGLGIMPAHSGNVALGDIGDGVRNPFDLANTATISNRVFDGALGEFWSWNTALTNAEISSINDYFDEKWINPNEAPVIVTNNVGNVDQGDTITIDDGLLDSIDDDLRLDWYDSDWDYRNEITIDSALVGSDLTDFTITLTGDNFGADFWNNVQNDGGDIVITSADGQTVLAREVVSIDTIGQTIELHVNVPLVSSTVDTDLFIYYGNAAANVANDAANTFSNYDHVYHMENLDAVDVVGAIDGTNSGGGSIVTGQLGNAHEYNNNGLVDIADINGANIRTISFWYTPESQGGGNYGSVLGSNGYNDGIRHLGTNELNVRDGGTAIISTSAAFNVAKHLVFSYDSGTGNLTLFENGVSQGSAAFGGWHTIDNLIGISDATNRAPDGIVDEIRISSNTIDADWAAAEYANQSSPSTFVSVGNQQVESSPPTYEITDTVDHGTLFIDANSDGIAQGGEIVNIGDTFTQDTIDSGLLKYTHDNTLAGDDGFSFTLTDGNRTSAEQTFALDINVPDFAPVIEGFNLVSFENFEGGTTLFNDNTTTNNGQFTEFLGRHSQDGNAQTVFTTYNLSGTQDKVVISFDFYEIDDWDGGSDAFQVYVDDVRVINESFRREDYNQPADGSNGNVSWTVQELETNTGNLGFNGGQHDQAYRYTLTIDTTNANVKLGFGSGLNGNTNDEAWGVDNLAVYENTPAGGSGITYEVSELSDVGHSVGTIKATDLNLDDLTYTIQGGNADGIFGIDATTGEITIIDTTNLDFESTTTYTLSIRATDDSGASLFDQENITINVLDAVENSAPTINALGALNTAENGSNGTVLGTVTSNDTEGNNITYSITNGNGDGIFAINNAGQISITDNTTLNFERDNSYTLTIRARDNGHGNLTSTRNVVINISDINEAPSFDAIDQVLFDNPNLVYNADTGNFYEYVDVNTNYNAANNDATSRTITGADGTVVNGHLVTITSAAENTFVRGIIGNHIWLGATDSGVEGEWRWTGGGTESGDLFWLGNGSGSAQNGYYENWRAGEPNGGNGTDTARFLTDGTWQDSNGNHRYVVEYEGASIINPVTHVIAENAIAMDIVGTTKATDQDGGQNLTYTIQSGNTDNIFRIDPTTGAIDIQDTSNLNFEGTNAYNLIIRATDNGSGNLFADQAVTINISDANDAPTDININSSSVKENSVLGTEIGTLSSVDEDVADTFTYTIIDDPDSKFDIVDDKLVVKGSLDYEIATSHTVTIRTFDGTTSFDRVFTIGIDNENDTPFNPPQEEDDNNDGDDRDNNRNNPNDTSDNGSRDSFFEDTGVFFQNNTLISSALNGDLSGAMYGNDGFNQIIFNNVIREARSIEASLLSSNATNGVFFGDGAITDLTTDAEQEELNENSENVEFENLRQALEFFERDTDDEGNLSEEADDARKAIIEKLIGDDNESYVKLKDVHSYKQARQAKLLAALSN